MKTKLSKAGLRVLRPITLSEDGYPDLWVLHNSTLAFVECKRPGEDLEPLQVFRKKELEQLGFHVFVIDDTRQCDEVIDFFRMSKSLNDKIFEALRGPKALPILANNVEIAELVDATKIKVTN